MILLRLHILKRFFRNWSIGDHPSSINYPYRKVSCERIGMVQLENRLKAECSKLHFSFAILAQFAVTVACLQT